MVVEHTNDETKTVILLFRFKRHKDETWVAYHTTCEMAKKIWIQMGLPFLFERIAESMWRALEWVCYEKSNTVINSPSVEKYEMVALPTNKNAETRSGKPHKMEAQVEMA